MKKTAIRFQTIQFFLLIILCSPSNGKAEEITIQREYLQILPNGRATGSILENWIAPVVFQQVETGGLSRVDSPRFSSYGISWIEQNYRINKIDITDPFRSGYPLFEPAWQSISDMTLKSRQENDPYRIGLNWDIVFPEETHPFEASYHAIFPSGGGSFIPEGEMDREPSFPFGASKKRRRYKLSNEVSGSYYSADKFYCGAEALDTSREFPALTDESGNYIDEKAEKYTLTMIYQDDEISMPYKILLIGQYNENDNYGANLRLDNRDTLTQKNFVNHLQYSARKKLPSGKIDILSGVTARLEKRDPHLESPGKIEFDSESGPVPEAGDINRINFDNSLNYTAGLFNVEAAFQVNAVMFSPEIPFSQTMGTYDGEVVSVTLWNDPEQVGEYVYNTKLKTEFIKDWDIFTLSGNIYLDNSIARANGENVLNWYGIGGKLLSKFNFDNIKTSLNLGLLHQPAKVNSYIVSFLDRGRPSGQTYTGWADSNVNGIADRSELAGGTLISTTGGEYHYKDENLKRPYHDEISAGVEKSIFNKHKIILQGSRRIFSEYFIVKYDRNNGTYSQAEDGTPIYTKAPGRDKYYLTNYSKERAAYSGVEIQTLWNWRKAFVNFSFTAFMVTGFAPAGNGPDNNDYAVISEKTADPNSMINSSGGRLDSDRAYKGNILFGWRMMDDLSLGLTVRYRDGEPFSQNRIYEDENGMPVAVMNKERGNWDGKGLGRYTFSWNIDIRLRYTPVLFGKNIEATVDIFNVLDSSTEILESNNIEDERRALEAVPPRMIQLGIGMLF